MSAVRNSEAMEGKFVVKHYSSVVVVLVLAVVTMMPGCASNEPGTSRRRKDG
jgi:hypothetical protein